MTQMHFNFIKFKGKLTLKAIYAIDKKIDILTVNQFEFLKCLGEGACGSVYLVRSRVTGYIFALKRVKKDSIRSDQDIKSVFR
jgi:serine/threonine protein kinase